MTLDGVLQRRLRDRAAVTRPWSQIADDGSMYLFSNDRSRGLDVYHYDGTPDAQAEAMGRWMSPLEAARTLTRFSVDELTSGDGFWCILR